MKQVADLSPEDITTNAEDDVPEIHAGDRDPEVTEDADTE